MVAGHGCEVVQITEYHDARSLSGLAFAMSACRRARAAGMLGLIWSSIPCVGGSARNAMNPVRHTVPFRRAKNRQRADFRLMWKIFDTLAREVLQWGWK